MAKRVYDRAHAAFRISGDDLDPLEVTRALSIPPDVQYRRGEPRLVRSGSRGKIEIRSPHQFGFWSFSSEAWVQSPRLEVHLAWLLDQVEPHGDTLRELQSRCRMDFFCYASGRSEQPPSISRSIRSRAAAIGVPIEIDYYPIPASK